MNLAFVNYSFAGTADSFRVSGRAPIGGGEVYLRDLCHLLQREGHEVTVVQGGSEKARFEADGIPVVAVPSRSRYRFNFDWPRGIPRGVDHVHLHDANHAYPRASPEMTSTFHGVSWDVPFSGMDPLAYAKWHSRNAFFKFLIRFAVKHCRKIVSVDSVLPRYVQARLPSYADKLTVIPNYVDLAVFRPLKVRKSTGRKVILLPRNLTRNRGIDLMLEAFAKLNRDNVELWVAGTGPLQPLVEEAARADSRIKFLGHKDHYLELPGLYNQADLVVVPSRGVEGTSLAVLEAMACGKTVIASRVGGIPDLVQEGKNGLLVKPTPDELRAALSRLLEDDGLRRRLGRNALARAALFSKRAWEGKWKRFARENFA